MRPVVFSASSIGAYEQCSLAWWFAYVAVIEVKPSYEKATGVAVHAAAEKILRGKLIEQEVTEREALAAYRLSMVEQGRAPTPEGEAATRLFWREVAPGVEPMLVEAPFELAVNGIGYSGILDWYDKGFWLNDLKTVAGRPSRRTAERYWLGQVGYALGARDLTGAEEAGTRLVYLVKTKTPYVWPVESPTVTDDDIDRFAARLENVAERVARGIYEPDGLTHPFACKTCDYAAKCGPRQRLLERRA